MIKEFNERFGIQVTIEEEQKNFINRATHMLDELRRLLGYPDYEYFFEYVALQLGKNPGNEITRISRFARNIPDVYNLIPLSFVNILKVLTVVRSYFLKKKDAAEGFDRKIEQLLQSATTPLGITYSEGQFFPAGEEVLDKELVHHSLEVLKSYPAEEKDLRTALEIYNSGKKSGVIENCYRCMEGLSRIILGNKKTLIDNKNELLKVMNLSDQWKKNLAFYIEFGNEYGRHASEKRHDAGLSET